MELDFKRPVSGGICDKCLGRLVKDENGKHECIIPAIKCVLFKLDPATEQPSQESPEKEN